MHNAQHWHVPHSTVWVLRTIVVSALGTHAVHQRPILKSETCVLYSLAKNKGSVSTLTLKKTKQQFYTHVVLMSAQKNNSFTEPCMQLILYKYDLNF